MKRSGLLPTHSGQANFLQMKYIFGLNGSMSDSLYFRTDNEILYQAGNSVIEYNIESRV